MRWGLFALGTLAILAFVPLAGPIQKLVREAIGEGGLRWGMAGLVAVAAVTVVGKARMVKLSIVAEAFHLVEYGLLGVLAFRALSCHLHEPAVYFAAAALTALVGTCDELVQWLTPGRYWGLRDVGLNAAGAVLAQLWIVVLRPAE
jgi:VanZ family protein